MRLLKIEDDGFSFTKEYANGDNDIPSYAILSHTWSNKEDEISMTDIKENRYKQKEAAYLKLKLCSLQAHVDGLRHMWIDTCYINQADSVELGRSINSMYRWYQNAAKCYVYLSDVQSYVSDAPGTSSPNSKEHWGPVFRQSRCFTRGWTLQELIAPRSVEFLSSDGFKLGDKVSLEQEIHQVTGIDLDALRGTDLSKFSFEKRMSWTEGRQTKHEEDIVYSLLGIFGVFLSLIYGEGKDNAHRRLRREFEDLFGEKPQPGTFNSPTDILDKFQTASFISRNFCHTCKEPGHHTDDLHCFRCDEYGHFAAAHKYCDTCGEYGHTSQDVHCYGCRKYGHYKRDCPEEGDSEESDSEESDD